MFISLPFLYSVRISLWPKRLAAQRFHEKADSGCLLVWETALKLYHFPPQMWKGDKIKKVDWDAAHAKTDIDQFKIDLDGNFIFGT